MKNIIWIIMVSSNVSFSFIKRCWCKLYLFFIVDCSKKKKKKMKVPVLICPPCVSFWRDQAAAIWEMRKKLSPLSFYPNRQVIVTYLYYFKILLSEKERAAGEVRERERIPNQLQAWFEARSQDPDLDLSGGLTNWPNLTAPGKLFYFRVA